MISRVLVAQTDITLARIIERSLRAHGFDIVRAASAAHALALVSDQDVGLALIDSGLDVCDRLRMWRPDLPIVMLAGVADDATNIRCHEDVLRKPFAFEELIARVRSRVDR